MQIRRRKVLMAMGTLFAAPRIAAQSAQLHRVGYLSSATRTDASNGVNALLEGLRALGYEERRNLELDARYGEYSSERTAKFAAEIAAWKPAVIVTSGGGIGPAIRLNPAQPVIFVHSGNPVDAGYVDSLARPGRNATGISLMALDLIGKRMEFLKQIRPAMRRIAFLASPEHAGQKRELAASLAAARQLGVEVLYHEARTPAELAAALPAVVEGKPDAALLFSDALMVGQREKLAEFFLLHKVPSAAGWSAFPDSGHLMSYGPERSAVWRRAANFVDRIIKGTRPSELPVELPTVFELVLNRRTASAMNLTLPPPVLAGADRVIE
jgi:putative ABC transport system substrate-binding protein